MSWYDMDLKPDPMHQRSNALEEIRKFLAGWNGEGLPEAQVALLFGHLLNLGWDRARSERVLKAAHWWL